MDSSARSIRIEEITIYPYRISLLGNQFRFGALLKITDSIGRIGWGEVAPLPKWSRETLDDCLSQLETSCSKIKSIEWTLETFLIELACLSLFPALSFAFESSLLSILDPLPTHYVSSSVLLMGSREEILKQAELRNSEGYTSAKLKVGNLSFEDAYYLIMELKSLFSLRIDVNRAWITQDSLHFFSEFPVDSFDYVEEPFQNPYDLPLFTHPLAVDESFPNDLSFEQLESIPSLKSIIYKPTIQGGLLNGIALHRWANLRGICFVLSSSFETDIGLAYVASIAHRLSIATPVGIGTFHTLSEHLSASPIEFSKGVAKIPSEIAPKARYSRSPLKTHI